MTAKQSLQGPWGYWDRVCSHPGCKHKVAADGARDMIAHHMAEHGVVRGPALQKMALADLMREIAPHSMPAVTAAEAIGASVGRARDLLNELTSTGDIMKVPNTRPTEFRWRSHDMTEADLARAWST